MKQSIPDNIFRAYDIRGIVGDGLDESIIHLIGRAIGSEALDLGERCLVLGADARLSSPAFARAMGEGILSAGCDVVDLGTIPTPLMYFATHSLECHSGVMITGSHNPGDYNGVKMVLQNQCLAADQITRLRDRIRAGDFREGSGELRHHDIQPAYLSRIFGDIPLTKSFRVVIDCGNGVTGNCAPMLFSALGCQVIPLHCEPDGNFPNHHPDPTRRENLHDLIACVEEEKADLGIAFDGDGDRIGLVSSSGSSIDADRMMFAFIHDILSDNPGASIVFDVKSSQQLPLLIDELKGKAVMCKSGHSFVKQKMQESGALLGGEYSAHIFFSHRWYGFDDGLYTAARFLELMDKHNCSADALLENWPTTCSTPELNVAVSDDDKFSIMATLQSELKIPGADITRLDGFRADIGGAWGLVRASNTTPNLVLRFEAESAASLENIMNEFREAIARLAPELTLDF